MELVVRPLLLIELLSFVQFGKVVEIVRADRVDALVDMEILATFLSLESAATVRATQRVLLAEPVLIRRKESAAYFAL